MAGPYYQRVPWTPFVHQGVVYSLSHLNEFQLEVLDKDRTPRCIVATFSDHCFTRAPESHDPSREYPGCSRQPGHFCDERYGCSLQLPDHIKSMTEGHVFNARENDSYAIVPIIDFEERQVDYRIVFSLTRSAGLHGIDLHLRVKTAYPALTSTPFVTHGRIRFSNLVSLRMRGKSPRRITSDYRIRR